MKRIFFLSFILFSFFFLNAQVPKETKTESSVNFKIKNIGINVDGHFDEVAINTLFNSAGELADISATIKAESITTGMESRDNHLFKEGFFYVEKYDVIVFKTIDLKKESLKSYLLTANLTIKNRTKQIIIPIHFEKRKGGIIIQSNFEINRKDFDIGGSSLILSKTVKIKVKHKQFY